MDHPSATLTPAARHSDSARAAAYAIATSHVRTTTAALIELGVFDALARAGPAARLTVQELAQAAMPQRAVNVRSLERMLRLMSSNGILIETVENSASVAPFRRFYELSPVGKFFVKNDDDESAGTFAYVLLYCENPSLHNFAATRLPLQNCVVGETSSPVGHLAMGDDTLHPLYTEFHAKNPAIGELFDKAMQGYSKDNMPIILDAYRGFQDVSVLVDVGGGCGASLRSITARYPHIKGVNFDLPKVIADNPELPGVEQVGGDMFESVPSGGDAIFMKWILHNWNDENTLTLLKNCWQSLSTGGKVIIVEWVLPNIINLEDCDRAAFNMDLIMMHYHDAHERTESEFRKLGLAAGFAQVNVVCQMESVGNILEMLKA